MEYDVTSCIYVKPIIVGLNNTEHIAIFREPNFVVIDIKNKEPVDLVMVK